MVECHDIRTSHCYPTLGMFQETCHYVLILFYFCWVINYVISQDAYYILPLGDWVRYKNDITSVFKCKFYKHPGWPNLVTIAKFDEIIEIVGCTQPICITQPWWLRNNEKKYQIIKSIFHWTNLHCIRYHLCHPSNKSSLPDSMNTSPVSHIESPI